MGTTEDCVCVDESGVARYYGEVWSVTDCKSCCCSAPGVVECSTIECNAPTSCAADEYVSATYQVDQCCSSVCCTKVECQETCKDVECPKVAQPTCEHYEDCKERAIDADCCCYEYYCECNKNKCYDLGECTCPPGFVRQIVDTDACCPIARCCQTTTVTSTKTTSYTTRTVTHTTPTTHIITTTPTVCIDREGCEREYGECWTYEEEPCMTYTCYSTNNIKATPRGCATQPKCASDEFAQEYQIDDCCCTYTCECNTSKCIDLGDCPCPEGTIAGIVDTDCCCPVQKCIPVHTTGTTPVYTTTPTPTPYIWTDPTKTPPCIPETDCTDYCYDHQGNERSYGDCWSPAECTYCVCDVNGTSKCSKTECSSTKKCVAGETPVVEKTADGCCNVVKCIPDDCDCSQVTCKFTPPTCQYYEDCVATRYDDCCCTYSCVCNKSLCCEIELASCPEGYIRSIVKADECCPVARCIECPSQPQPPHHTSHILVPIPLLHHTQLSLHISTPLHQPRPPPSSLLRIVSASTSQALPDTTAKSGQSLTASHVAVAPQVLSSAQPLSATPQHHVPPTSTSQPPTRLTSAAHQFAALRSNVRRHARTLSVQRSLSQHANTTRTARSVPLMPTAAATSTTANATRTSATILASAHAHQALSDRSLILMLAVQLLDAARQQLSPAPRPHHTLHEPSHTPPQLPTSSPPHQLSALTVRVVSVSTVSAGHTRRAMHD